VGPPSPDETGVTTQSSDLLQSDIPLIENCQPLKRFSFQAGQIVDFRSLLFNSLERTKKIPFLEGSVGVTR